MKITAQADFSVINALNRRGLGKSKKVQKYMAARAKYYMDKYVPMQSADLKNMATISPGATAIVYNQPYAHYQYQGEVMAGRAPKHYTGADLQHHGAPTRGAHWDKRMKADNMPDLVREAAAYIDRSGGK